MCAQAQSGLQAWGKSAWKWKSSGSRQWSRFVNLEAGTSSCQLKLEQKVSSNLKARPLQAAWAPRQSRPRPVETHFGTESEPQLGAAARPNSARAAQPEPSRLRDCAGLHWDLRRSLGSSPPRPSRQSPAGRRPGMSQPNKFSQKVSRALSRAAAMHRFCHHRACRGENTRNF